MTRRKGPPHARAAKKRLTPRTARSLARICSLPRDGVRTRDFWLLLDIAHVSIAEQTRGEPSKYIMHIPRRVFDRFVDFYNGVPMKRAGRRKATT